MHQGRFGRKLLRYGQRAGLCRYDRRRRFSAGRQRVCPGGERGGFFGRRADRQGCEVFRQGFQRSAATRRTGACVGRTRRFGGRPDYRAAGDGFRREQGRAGGGPQSAAQRRPRETSFQRKAGRRASGGRCGGGACRTRQIRRGRTEDRYGQRHAEIHPAPRLLRATRARHRQDARRVVQNLVPARP